MTVHQSKTQAQQIWAKYKYEVLSKSPQLYLRIREVLKQDDVTPEMVFSYIELAQRMDEVPSYFINAAQHMWGYFKKNASPDEKEHFLAQLAAYAKGEVSSQVVLQELKRLLDRYPNSYLEHSSIMKGDR